MNSNDSRNDSRSTTPAYWRIVLGDTFKESIMTMVLRTSTWTVLTYLSLFIIMLGKIFVQIYYRNKHIDRCLYNTYS